MIARTYSCGTGFRPIALADLDEIAVSELRGTIGRAMSKSTNLRAEAPAILYAVCNILQSLLPTDHPAYEAIYGVCDAIDDHTEFGGDE
jgi:hypothetical protein